MACRFETRPKFGSYRRVSQITQHFVERFSDLDQSIARYVFTLTDSSCRALILAGGDGVRLRPLTRLICGDSRPKQFCPLLGRQTLLGRTRARVGQVVAPERTYFAVSESHQPYYSRELACVDPARILAQPANRGTAAAIAYGCVRILNEDPGAVIAMVPADHHYDDEAPFIDALWRTFGIARAYPSRIVLLGAEADRAETEFGWIEPGETSGQVSRFCEKPAPEHAQDLLARGCLWNTFVMTAYASTFRDILRDAIPAMVGAFERALDGKPELSRASARWLYNELESADFSHQVLSVSTDRLLVTRLAHAGWNDLGNPERVLETLERAGIRPDWHDTPGIAWKTRKATA